jgi:UDP-glucose 4-epimerase
MTSSPQSCVVLGGGGFLGTNLCRRLVAAGVRVRAFGRSRSFPDALVGVDWREGDFADPAALASAVDSCDVVFHLIHAHMPQTANLNMAEDIRQSVVPSLALLDIGRKLGVKRIVFVSSGGTVYGAAKDIPTPESAPTDPITAYGVGKLMIEKYLGLYERLHGLSFRVLRVANPFGPFQVPDKGQGLIATLLSRALRGEPIEVWGDGSVVRDYVFVDDVIEALQAAAVDESDGRVFNVGSGRGHSVREVIAAVEAQLGKKLSVAWKPGRPIDVPVSILSIARSRDLLGWAPRTSFDDGLRRTIAWWRSRSLTP